MEPPHAVPERSVLAGKYHLLRQLGRGGMGSVWYAEHLTLHSPVAVKLIDPEIATNPEALARFMREAQSAAALRSPHVVQILDHGVDDGVPFIVMELLEGESLAGRLTRVGHMSPLETARILTHVGRAIGRAHEAGIVHRDLKPDNVFIVKNDEEEVAKVLDFGIAKTTTLGLGASATSGTRTGALLGTPYYMSPEQAEGDRNLDHRTDIWSMGVIAFECMLGRRPFDGETLGTLLLAICAREIPLPSRYGPVPQGFDAWFLRACARDVKQRFASAKEAATDLRRVCDSPAFPGASSDAHAQNFARESWSANAHASSDSGFRDSAGTVPKSRAALIVFLCLAVLGLLGAAFAWMKLRPSPEAAPEPSATAVKAATTPQTEPPATPPIPRPKPEIAVTPEVLPEQVSPPPPAVAAKPEPKPAPAPPHAPAPRRGAPAKPLAAAPKPPPAAAQAPPPRETARPAPAPAAPSPPGGVDLGI